MLNRNCNALEVSQERGRKENVTALCVFGNVKARAKSIASMFGVRSASVGPPRAAQPNVGSLLYRGKLGGRVGRGGGEEREEGGWALPSLPSLPQGAGGEREERGEREGREGREVSS